MIPTFYGRVLPGGLHVRDRPKDYARYVRSLGGQFVEETLRKRRTKRSSKANRFYWGYVLEEIASAAEMTKDETHFGLKLKFLGDDIDGPLVKVKSTADLSTEEFSAYTERCMAFGSQTFGIEWETR